MGSVVIGIVLLLRLFLRRAPKIFSYVLWLIVLFRLLCPVSVALPVSVFNLIPAGQMSVAGSFPAQEHPGQKAAHPDRMNQKTARLSQHFPCVRFPVVRAVLTIMYDRMMIGRKHTEVSWHLRRTVTITSTAAARRWMQRKSRSPNLRMQSTQVIRY